MRRAVTAFRRVVHDLEWSDLLPTASVELDAPTEYQDGGEQSLEEVLASTAPSPEEELLASEMRARLDDLADRARLRPRQRAVLRLRYGAGLTLEQSASALGVTKQAVHDQQRRALISLRDELEPADWERFERGEYERRGAKRSQKR